MPTLRIHSLRTRIALAFTSFLLVTQLLAFMAISSMISSNAHHNVDAQLKVAQKVFEQVVKTRRERLSQAALVVAADFGFRDAVASHDRATIVSALRNHGERINADLVMLVGLDGMLVADTRVDARPGRAFPFPALLRNLKRHGASSTIGTIDGRLYELVAVPVKTPTTIAWVAMGFVIDQRLAKNIQDIASLDVSFLGKTPSGKWLTLASSLPKPAQAALPAALGSVELRSGSTQNISVLGQDYGTRIVPIEADGPAVVVALQRSLADAMLPFHRLQSALAFLTVIGLMFSVVISLLIARGVTRPIGTLIEFARAIAMGNSPAQIAVVRHDELGELAATFNSMRTALIERERRITDLAYRDPLTNLPNRALFSDRLQQAINLTIHQGQSLAVMMMDLDRFKYVNDTLGHHIGDLLLIEVSRRLGACLLHETDTVARLGGDEFAVLLPAGDKPAAQHAAMRMIAALEQPIILEGQVVDVSASIGIVTLPQDGADMHTLMRRADVAMYGAKREGLGWAFYDSQHDTHTPERLSLMSELRHAVEHDELTLYYQPKVDLETGSVKYVEALLRWNHATRGHVAPDQFIPFAEQTGYIKTISRWVVEKAIKQCAEWQARGIQLHVSINVSVRDLLGTELPEVFAEILQRYELAAEWVWVEITESALMDDPQRAMETLDRLHALGLRLFYRRFRHRLFVAVLPEAHAGGRTQDRQEFCHGHGDRQGR